MYPKAPERKWAFPSVGNTVCLCFHYIPAAIESQWDYPTHGVTNLNTKHKEKNTVKMDDRVGVPSMVWIQNGQFEG